MPDIYDLPDDVVNSTQEDRDDWKAAQQADDEARRWKAGEAWQRIKRGEYTETDLQVIEQELRGIL